MDKTFILIESKIFELGFDNCGAGNERRQGDKSALLSFGHFCHFMGTV